MPDIFLSYNREDAAVAQTYRDAFEREGFDVWWDATLRSGEAYDEVTEGALRGAKAVVVLWSKKSVVSRWVRAEATLADRNRTLVPARIEACDLPIMFELTQTADLTHWEGEPKDPVWRAFLGDVRRFVEIRATPELPVRSAPGTKPPARGSRPSIAVLPFINPSGLSEDDVFADGMVEDLTAALSVSRRMKVIASSATAAYRTGVRDLRQIGRDLGVRYLLEGNVRRVGDTLRVSAQLVEADDGDIVWTQKFDRPLAELSALQEELVTEVAAYLGVEVQRAEMEHALRKPGDITAWEAVLRADANVSRQTLAGYEAAVTEAKRAISIDPNYDLAHATLAMALGTLFTVRGGDDRELAREVINVATRARAFDTTDPIALSRIGIALCSVGKFRDALPFSERAVSVNPNLESPRIGLSAVLLSLGRWEEAIAETEAAMRLAPNGIWTSASLFQRSMALFFGGQIERSLETAEQALRLRLYVPVQVHRIICLARLDRRGEAGDAVRAFREANPQLSIADVRSLASNFLYRGMNPSLVADNVQILQKLWDETGGDA